MKKVSEKDVFRHSVIYSDADERVHIHTCVAGLDQKISHKVTAGLAHCVCLTGMAPAYMTLYAVFMSRLVYLA